VVAGSSGQAYGFPLNHPAMYSSMAMLGSLVVDVENERLDVRFLNSVGAFADHFSMQKTLDGPVVLPGEPMNLAVLPLNATSALLRWDDVAAECGYDIASSANGVGFNLIGTTGGNANSFTVPNLIAAGQIYLRVTARNFNGSTPSAVFSYTHSAPGATLGPIAQWRFVHFGDASDAGAGSSVGDPDHDGSTNLMEYAFGTNPRAANVPITLRWNFDEDLGTYVYNFDRLARTDLSYAVEASDDLTSGSWTTLFTSSGIDNIQEMITVEDPAIGVSVRRFARLKISKP
jgi:hypothetical protein